MCQDKLGGVIWRLETVTEFFTVVVIVVVVVVAIVVAYLGIGRSHRVQQCPRSFDIPYFRIAGDFQTIKIS